MIELNNQKYAAEIHLNDNFNKNVINIPIFNIKYGINNEVFSIKIIKYLNNDYFSLNVEIQFLSEPLNIQNYFNIPLKMFLGPNELGKIIIHSKLI